MKRGKERGYTNMFPSSQPNDKYDIHSIDFYKLMAQAHADKNADGKIDASEQTEYDNYMSIYDMDKNGVFNENDVQLKKETSVFTTREKRYQYELEEYIKDNNLDLNNVSGWSKEQIEKYTKLCEGANLIKTLDVNKFKKDCIDTLSYLKNTGRNEEYNNYMQSYNKTYDD